MNIMGCRRQSRTAAAITANVCGTDSAGRVFMERVTANNISRDGALLEGVRCQLRPGDVVVVRCGDNTGRFRIVWEQREGSGNKRFGVARLTSSSCLEDLEGSDPEKDDYLHPRTHTRRQSLRYRCEIAAELRLKNISTPMWVTSVNLGEDGCAVNTLVSVPPGTELNIAMWLGKNKVWAQGIVVTSLYGLGTGIHFTAISRQGREYLREFLATQTEVLPDRRVDEVSAAPVQKRDREEFTVSVPLVIYEDMPVLD
jgi:hypothetical protein